MEDKKTAAAGGTQDMINIFENNMLVIVLLMIFCIL
jgi:hypothetical protein